jgi:hypothetical protein
VVKLDADAVASSHWFPRFVNHLGNFLFFVHFYLKPFAALGRKGHGKRKIKESAQAMCLGWIRMDEWIGEAK